VTQRANSELGNKSGGGFMKRAFLVLGLAALFVVGCKKDETSSTGGSGGTASTQSSLTIAVIPKGTTHAFWRAVDAGAEDAGAKLGVKIIWKGPLKEDDRMAQITVIQQFVSQGVSGIVVAPLDSKALLEPVQKATSSKIPVVIMDSALEGTVGQDFVSFVATDNHKGGELGGEELARIMGNKGNVVLLRYAEGSASTEAREAGFLEAIAKHPDMKVISENHRGGATADSAAKASLNMIDELKNADGIFAPNESTTAGMLSALRSAGVTGKKFVGFDATSQLVEALKAGEVQALVAQNPYKMGYESVTTLVNSIRGEKVEPRVDTGVQVITKESLDKPEVQDLLKRS
jgi:ribose transport system substrate-binding protein